MRNIYTDLHRKPVLKDTKVQIVPIIAKWVSEVQKLRETGLFY